MDVKTVDYTAPDAQHSLAESLRETGFAVLVNHPISAPRIDEAYALWSEFFASDDKMDWLRHPETQDGFFPFISENA